jgi:thioesterase domain-containing protein
VLGSTPKGIAGMAGSALLSTAETGKQKHRRRVGGACGAAVRFVPIRFPDWTEMLARELDLDGLVAEVAAAIVAQSPSGPLRLAGYSFGGHVAYAVAGRLVASGRQVAQFGLLDVKAFPTVASAKLSGGGRLQRFTASMAGGDVALEIGRIMAGLLVRPGSAAVLRLLARARDVRLPFALQDHLHTPLQMRFRMPMLQALLRRMTDRPQPLDVGAVLFRCHEQDPGEVSDLGWGPYLRPLRIVDVPGHHSTLLEPANLARLADAFVAAMVA